MDWGDFIERQRHRDWPIAVAVLGLLAAGYGFFRLEKPHYEHWKERRELGRARIFLARGDLGDARVALEIARRRRAPEVYDAIADYYEQLGSDSAILARRLAAEMAPADLNRRLALVRTALRFNDRNSAAAVLEACSPAEKADPAYQRAAVAFDFLSADWAGALRRLQALGGAVKSDPGLRLIRDAIGLKEAQPAARAAAAADLEVLSAVPGQQAPALRVRLADAFVRREPEEALAAAQALVAAPGNNFGDWIDAAAAERMARPATGADPALLQRIRARASVDPAAGAAYASWLWAEEGPAPARAWLAQIPKGWRDLPPIRTELAREAALAGDWPGLRSLLAAGAWGPISGSTLDFAYAARIAAGRGAPDLARQTWEQALDDAGASPGALGGLVRLAAAWHWPEAQRAALVAGVRAAPDNAALFRSVAEELRSQRDTQGLLEAATAAGADAPGNEARQENWAMLSLLAEPPAAPNAATRILESLHAGAPGNPYYTTNYAFALWRLGQFNEACVMADSLSENDRLLPTRAPYLAVIYASAGRPKEARAILTRAPPAGALLPEEGALLDQARAKVAP